MSLLDKSTRREFMAITSSAALGAAVPLAGAQPEAPVSNPPLVPLLKRFLIHRKNSSTTGRNALSAATAPPKSRCPWEGSEPAASV